MALLLKRDIKPRGWIWGDVYNYLSNVRDIVNNTKALANALRASYQDGLLTIATLAIDGTATKYQTTTTAYYRIAGVQYSKAAAAAIVLTGTHTITNNKFGIFLVQVNAAGTISTKDTGATMAFNSSALAIAALPAPDAANVALGYILVAPTGGTFTAGTTALTTIGTFVDGTPLTAFTNAAVSDSDLKLTHG